MAAAASADGALRPLEQLGGEYGAQRYILFAGFILASILEVLDTSIINPVLPEMAGSLGCTTQEISWVSTAYILANVVFLPMTAWLANRFGLRNYMLASIGMFIVASMFCGTAHSLQDMIIWRLVQGACGAPLLSMTQAALAEVLPKREQTMAQGLWGLSISVAPTFAPTLGGWLSDTYSWPLVFFINLPLGIIAMLLIGPIYKNRPRPNSGGVDWLGIGLLAVGLGSIQYILEEGNREDWFQSPIITRFTILGLIGTTAFVLWQLSRRNKAPVTNLRVLRNPTLMAGTVVGFISGIGLYSGLFVFPVFASAVLGFTAYRTGTFMLLPGLVMACSMIITSVLMQKGVSVRVLVPTGVAIVCCAMWVLGHLSPLSNESDAQLGLAMRSFGLSFYMLPVMVASIAGLKKADVGAGAALMGLSRQLGGSIGIAVASTYMTHMTQVHRYGLMEHLYSGSQAAAERLNLLAGAFHINGGLDIAQAGLAAAKLVDGQVTRQAFAMASNDVFLMTGALFILTTPFIFLFKDHHKQVDMSAVH